MIDPRRFYINQILNHYKIPYREDNSIYSVEWTYDGKKKHHHFLSHNEGLKLVADYIKELQDKIDELQYIERIIDAAKEGSI